MSVWFDLAIIIVIRWIIKTLQDLILRAQKNLLLRLVICIISIPFEINFHLVVFKNSTKQKLAIIQDIHSELHTKRKQSQGEYNFPLIVNKVIKSSDNK